MCGDRLTETMISQYVHIENHYAVYLKLTQWVPCSLYLNLKNKYSFKKIKERKGSQAEDTAANLNSAGPQLSVRGGASQRLAGRRGLAASR